MLRRNPTSSGLKAQHGKAAASPAVLYDLVVGFLFAGPRCCGTGLHLQGSFATWGADETPLAASAAAFGCPGVWCFVDSANSSWIGNSGVDEPWFELVGSGNWSKYEWEYCDVPVCEDTEDGTAPEQAQLQSCVADPEARAGPVSCCCCCLAAAA